jgi:hypothetical protein
VAVIDQVDKRFVPRVNMIRTGTGIYFPRMSAKESTALR